MESLRILIVEDEAIVALEIKHRLEKMGHFVCGVAAYGEKAIELADQNKPNLALMDINLKGVMNGIEAAAIIAKNFLIPSIFISAFSDNSTMANIKQTTNYEYLPKPFKEHDLIQAIKTTMHNYYS